MTILIAGGDVAERVMMGRLLSAPGLRRDRALEVGESIQVLVYSLSVALRDYDE